MLCSQNLVTTTNCTEAKGEASYHPHFIEYMKLSSKLLDTHLLSSHLLISNRMSKDWDKIGRKTNLTIEIELQTDREKQKRKFEKL